ncbi:hypothetical protein HYX16_02260 [Candidatus Woesearchaeota archaeon]|nr:hypothetical protein [Candidatus Woesearchaeota archaeon]
MENRFTLVFDEVILKQLKQVDNNIKKVLSKMFDELEIKGPNAGKLLDSHLFIYEIKNKHPPIRLYFKYKLMNNEIYVFEFEMKTSKKKQKKTISKIKFKAEN